MLTLTKSQIPERLTAIDSPPSTLYVEGNLAEILHSPVVAIVGSRKISTYGRDITKHLAGELAEQGIVIVSGLAFGVDSIAHQAALDAGGRVIAVLPTPLDRIYPAAHRQLARHILENGGALVSEYAAGSSVYKTNFVARNRIIAGLADATLLTEAALKSGSLHTARFALNAGRDVLAVPGNITSPTSEGTNNLIKSGATPVTSADDVLHVLGLLPVNTKPHPVGANDAEQIIIDLVGSGITDGAVLQSKSNLSVTVFNQTLTMLEITGKIRSLGANQWSLP
ncbi:DNA-processing protein DprA [soil metagenome]